MKLSNLIFDRAGGSVTGLKRVKKYPSEHSKVCTLCYFGLLQFSKQSKGKETKKCHHRQLISADAV
jgi:hypothetical protein